MIKNIFRSVVLFGAAAVLFVSCSKEYLETAPQSSTAPATIFESTDNAALAINGIAKMMTTQYLSTQGMNGEGTIITWYSNFTGNDFFKCNQTGWAALWNTTYCERATSSYDYYPWYYYYKLIGNANQIIVNFDDENLENIEGTIAEKQFIKAQALTYRAYCFFMLSQLYCNRWDDSNNGATSGLVLRTDTSTGEWPLSTLAQVYERVYGDLDEAIRLFTESKLDRASGHFWEPNLYVAYAIYARAALTKQDWANAASYANKVRTSGKFALMSKDEYFGGFYTPNNEWIWGVYEAADQTLYYYSLYAYMGSNASSSNCRSYPCAISKDLYDQIPKEDARRALWLEPTPEEYADKNLSKTTGQSTGLLATRAKKEYADKIYETSLIFMYMQFKHRAEFMPGGGSFNLFRLAEMYLTEAEALCHQGGKEQEVQKLLKDLNKAHNPGYTCAKTGNDLLTEVKLYRRIDLWGEGKDWFDYKRWNETSVRKSIANGGNWHATYAITRTPADCNKWTWVIPQKEKDYNPAL